MARGHGPPLQARRVVSKSCTAESGLSDIRLRRNGIGQSFRVFCRELTLPAGAGFAVGGQGLWRGVLRRSVRAPCPGRCQLSTVSGSQPRWWMSAPSVNSPSGCGSRPSAW